MPVYAVETKMSEGMTVTLSKEKAVVLLSGGLDSTVTAYIAKEGIGKGGKLYAMTFNYGQEHTKEIDYALATGEQLEVEEHMELEVDIPATSSLMGQGDIPFKEEEGIPSTWVPQRNSIFLALAFAYAETLGADKVYIGVNSKDYSGYPDCRPEFIQAMGKALNLASKRAVEEGKYIGIVVPLQYLSKVDIIRKGIELGVNFADTWSCYRGRELACGQCPSCIIRLRAFKELGEEDPLGYEKAANRGGAIR